MARARWASIALGVWATLVLGQASQAQEAIGGVAPDIGVGGGSKYLLVKLGKETGIIFSSGSNTILQQTCTIITLTTTITPAPMFSNFTTTTSPTHDSCRQGNQNVNAYGVGTHYRYTWTSTTASQPVDPFAFTVSDSGTTSFQAELLPSGASNAWIDWGNPLLDPLHPRYVTSGFWQARLLPLTINFALALVRETNQPGVNPVDTCWDITSTVPANQGVSDTNPTPLDDNNGYVDHVGWGSDAVEYYRMHAKAPCGLRSYQQMQISFDAYGDPTWYDYGPVNVLTANITATTVSSSRAGQTKTKTW